MENIVHNLKLNNIVLNDKFVKLSVNDKNTSGINDSVNNYEIKKRKSIEERDSSDNQESKEKKFKDSKKYLKYCDLRSKSTQIDKKHNKNFKRKKIKTANEARFGPLCTENIDDKCVIANTSSCTENNIIEGNKVPAVVETEQNKIMEGLQNANSFIEAVRELFSIDYESPSTRLNGYAHFETFEKNHHQMVEGASINEDWFATFMKIIKENEWHYVFSNLTTRFNSSQLAPTIVIRCIFHFILATNDANLLEDAIYAISSYWQTHQPSSAYAKKYYNKLLLETEDLSDYPASIDGKMFNNIFNQLLTSLLGENCLSPRHIFKELMNSEPLDKQSESDFNKDSSEDDDGNTQSILTPEEQQNSIVIAFKLLLDLLETDFIQFLVKYKKEPSKSIYRTRRQPLVTKLEDIPELKIVLKAFHSCDNMEHAKKISRFINLLAEVTRVWELQEEDRGENSASVLKHPYFGTKCIKFADELADSIKHKQSWKEKVDVLALFQSWLQMFVCSRWLTERMAITADPSITFVVKILKLYSKEVPETTVPDVKVQVPVLPTDPDKRPNSSSCFENPYKDLFLKHNISPQSIHRRNIKGETKIMEMCRKNKTDVVRALLTLQDIDVNACCNAGWTPLHEATISGNIDILDMLLSYNPGLPNLKPVNIYASNPSGITALHEAADIGNLEICKLLVEKGGAKLIEMETNQGVKPSDNTSSNEIKEYFQKVLTANQSFDFSKKQVVLNLDMIDLILLRELTFAYTNVYPLKEIMRRYKQKISNASKKTTQNSIKQCTDKAKLKIDFNIISDNIKAFRELKSILKSLINQHKRTRFFKPLKDWLGCLN